MMENIAERLIEHFLTVKEGGARLAKDLAAHVSPSVGMGVIDIEVDFREAPDRITYGIYTQEDELKVIHARVELSYISGIRWSQARVKLYDPALLSPLLHLVQEQEYPINSIRLSRYGSLKERKLK